MEPTQTPTLRRNGKRPSCEPCRKSKLSCDHATPICGRCQRRGVANKCTYHPAPMTGQKSQRGRVVDRKSLSTPSTPIRDVSAELDHAEAPQTSIARFQPAPGFLGSTSYSAVFTESQGEMGLDSSQDQHETNGEHARRLVYSREDKCKIREGAEILEELCDFPTFEPFVERWVERVRGIALISPFMATCLASIKRDLYDRYVKTGEQADLLCASEQLFDNSSRPIKLNGSLAFSDYPSLFTGENLRWETVGTYFTAVGLGVGGVPCLDPLLKNADQEPINRAAVSKRMLRASNTCIAFCDEAGQLNDPGMWLSYENFILMSWVYGDSSYLTWRRLGDLTTAVFAMGIHQEIRTSPDNPFWFAELRKKTFAMVYSVDKLLATFVGRPPRISQRYCSIQLPLDLDENDLVLQGHELALTLEKVDANGWNTDGRMRRSGYIRTFLMISLIREEVLELCLGPHQDNILQIGTDIARRSKDMWNSFPNCWKYDSSLWSTCNRQKDCYHLATTAMDHIYNEFLLQRTLVKRARAKSDDLFNIARHLMKILLEVLGNQHRIGNVAADIPWMVAIYGLPCGGVLALELLQQSQSRTYPNKNFPRSEVIQNLSVLVAALDSIVQAGDGNYILCMQARRMIQRILDRVLSPEPVSAPYQPTILTPTYNETNDEGRYDFSWMDDADFDVDFWANLPDHPLLATSDVQ